MIGIETTIIVGVLFFSRTEIQGGPGGPWPPQIFSIVAAVSLYSFIRISDYQIGTPFSNVYLVQFLPFISPGSPLAVCTSHQTCPTPVPCVHPKIDLPVISICIEEQKLALFKSNLRILVSIFPGEYPQTSLKVLAHFSRRPVFPWPPQVKNCISVLGFFPVKFYQTWMLDPSPLLLSKKVYELCEHSQPRCREKAKKNSNRSSLKLV